MPQYRLGARFTNDLMTLFKTYLKRKSYDQFTTWATLTAQCIFITGNCAKRIRQYLVTRAIWIFCILEQHVATMGWNLASIFNPIGARMGYGPPKLKILPKFCNINAPQRRIPQAIFTNFSLFVDDFIEGYALKFGRIRSRGFGVMGLKFRGCLSPKFSASLSGRNIRQMWTCFRVQEWYGTHLSPCQVWWGSDFMRRRGQQSCMFFYFSLSVTLNINKHTVLRHI